MGSEIIRKIIRVIKAYLPGQKWITRRDVDSLRSEYDQTVKALNDLREVYEKTRAENGEHFATIYERLNALEGNQGRLDALEGNLNTFRNDFENVCINLRNNNDIWKRHEEFMATYLSEDKKSLDTLTMEIPKLRADLEDGLEKFDNIKSLSVQPGMTGSQMDEENNITEQTSCADSAGHTDVNGNTYNSIDYFDFENHFRGPREQVKEVQKIYLPYFEGRKNVLDLGCGRGEFTELLAENGIGVTGVDMYRPYVEFMKMRGLPAVYGDAVEYLRKQETVDGIFMGQVVEHMPIETVIEILNIAREKLTSESYIIMETPNPMSLAVYTGSFYMDPSHNKLIHPLTLQYLTQKAGFNEANILFTESSKMPDRIPLLNGDTEDIAAFNNSMRRVENMLFGSQDYAIIARKA